MNNFSKNERIYNMHFEDKIPYKTIASITGTTCVAVRQRALKYQEHLELMKNDLYAQLFNEMQPLDTDGKVAHLKHLYNNLRSHNINTMDDFMNTYPDKFPLPGIGNKSDDILFSLWFNYLQ